MAKLIIPTPLRKFTNNQSSIETSQNTVGNAIKDLTKTFPELEKHLYNDGELRSFVRIFVGNDDIQLLDNESTFLSSESVISIVPAIAGGVL